ncbi:MAG: DUF72 domain-containing protein [Gemmatimonas sp.]|nr:DUF72 domain-containing protein [Gemmatimonas sp.]
MEVLTGTSGFAYKEWKGSFYPEDLPASKMLSYYGERFQAVEINNTFYRMPSETTLGQWADTVPEGFLFALKASQRITHRKRLKEVDDPVAYFLGVARSLGPHLGPLLFQLPPNLKKDLSRLRAFTELLPEDLRVAMEFRHLSWFDDDVLEVLREGGVALCIAQDEKLETPFVATADWGYLRLRRVRYDDAELTMWIDRVQSQDWSAAYLFFKHEEAGTGPKLARRVGEIFAARGA